MIKFYFGRHRAIFLFFLILFADQLSKSLVSFLFPWWMMVNSGMAWGLLAGRNGWWSALSCLLLVVLLFLAFKAPRYSWMIAIIWGGGVSNFFDRLVYSGVRDWLRIGFLPAFNLADLAITLGVIFLGASFLRSGDGAKNNPLKPHKVFPG